MWSLCRRAATVFPSSKFAPATQGSACLGTGYFHPVSAKPEEEIESEVSEVTQGRVSDALPAEQRPPLWRRVPVPILLIFVAMLAVGGYGLYRKFAGLLIGTGDQPRSLAILPFRNLKQDAASDFLGFSLADAVITKLGYVSALTVRPSSAVEKYRNQVIEFRRSAMI